MGSHGDFLGNYYAQGKTAVEQGMDFHSTMPLLAKQQPEVLVVAYPTIPSLKNITNHVL